MLAGIHILCNPRRQPRLGKVNVDMFILTGRRDLMGMLVERSFDISETHGS